MNDEPMIDTATLREYIDRTQHLDNLKEETHKLTDEVDRLRAEVANYRAAICFETTCTNCAGMLDHLASTEATCDQLQSSLTETASARDFLARSLEKQVDITERTAQSLENAWAERDRLRAENNVQAQQLNAVRKVLFEDAGSSHSHRLARAADVLGLDQDGGTSHG